VLSLELQQSVYFTGTYSKIKYDRVNNITDLLSEKSQYIISLKYNYAENFTLGYEYVINKEKLPVSSSIKTDNDLQIIKLNYIF
jgi:hypothetical protein